jgi:uncharacterized surface protein with fasciclin (FAS1) repeats
MNLKIMLTIALVFFAAVAGMSSDNDPTPEKKSNVTADQNIVELAASQENLSTLVKAVQAAGLVDVLKGDGPFTVFAPTNAAFDALPDGVLEMLLKPENVNTLKSILTYHVIGSKVMSTDLSDGASAGTVEGSDVNISIDGSTVMVEGATVTTADVEATNGVVHIIDKVILPPSVNL